MPRVHFVKKARKDNPAVKKGESYYHWKFRYGGKHYSKTRPKPSQLTQSDKLSRIYSVAESFEGVNFPSDASDYEDINVLIEDCNTVKDAYESAAEELREIAEEYNDSADAKEEYFPGTGDEIREKADACENAACDADDAANEWDNAISELEGLEMPEPPEPKEPSEEDDEDEEDEEEFDPYSWREEADSILSGLTNDVPEVEF